MGDTLRNQPPDPAATLSDADGVAPRSDAGGINVLDHHKRERHGWDASSTAATGMAASFLIPGPALRVEYRASMVFWDGLTRRISSRSAAICQRGRGTRCRLCDSKQSSAASVHVELFHLRGAAAFYYHGTQRAARAPTDSLDDRVRRAYWATTPGIWGA